MNLSNEQFFIWFPNIHYTLISFVFSLWIINEVVNRWRWRRTYLHELRRKSRAIITTEHVRSKTRATIPQDLQRFNSVGGKQFCIVKNCKTCGCHPWYHSFKIMAVCETSWLFTIYAWPNIRRKFELGKTENKSSWPQLFKRWIALSNVWTIGAWWPERDSEPGLSEYESNAMIVR